MRLSQPLQGNNISITETRSVILGEPPKKIKDTFNKVVISYCLSDGAHKTDFITEGKIVNIGKIDNASPFCKSFKETYWFEVEYKLKWLDTMESGIAHKMRTVNSNSSLHKTVTGWIENIAPSDVVAAIRVRFEGDKEEVVSEDMPF
jgi:hypothetical protein